MIAQRGCVSERVVLGVLCLLLGTTARATAPQPAFPGAEGFGAYAKGGRGGRIIEVTNLNARGPGSLHAACDAKGPRIVVFRVSGIIDGSVHVMEPFCTIAGQTAPGDGICIRRGELRVHTHDVVIRYLRSRPGDHPLGPNGEDRDCFDFSGNAHDVIIDHYSDRAKYGSDRTDPTGPDTGECRTVCGGHFRYVPSQVLRRRPFTGHRPHYRGFGLGFRLRRALP